MRAKEKPRFKVGQQFIRRGTKRKDVETIVDIYVTKNLSGVIAQVEYVATHKFMGQEVRARAGDATVARGLLP